MGYPQQRPPKKGLSAKQWAAVALVILAAVFMLQNLAFVRVEFFLVHSTAPLWLVLLITLAAGYAIGWSSRRRD